MRVIEKEEFQQVKEELKKRIHEGVVFIHPTDTIYGIGCNALDSKAVNKVREIKQRYTRPFSVIAPSRKWIHDVCKDGSNKKQKEWIDKLPGPYTLIISLKDKDSIAKETNNGMETVGVRIPEHWFSEFVEELDIPIITTSANIIGKDYMTSLDNLDPKIKGKLDFIIYEGEKAGKPSKLVYLTEEEVKVKER